MKLDLFVDSLWNQLNITNKTKKNYIGAYSRYIAPDLGNSEIRFITKAQLIEATANLTPQTRYQAVMVCRVIFREAFEREIIEDNPAARVKTPKVEVKALKFLTWEEIKVTEFGFHNDRIRFLALHGLRYGEAAALSEADIFDNRVHINKSIHGATKTKAGVRVVPYVGHFKKFPKTRKPLAKILNANGVNIHSLRKTYAYVLKSNGVHVTTAQRLMGHASPMVTLGIYTAVLDDEIISTGKILIDKYMK